MQIKDILTIDLTVDIKNVIDLENISETEILLEIESYIVTEGLAREFDDFVTTYSSGILETGVWISGFYGSGKSYFAKLLGYLIHNSNILGTPARDRILQRFTGVQDEALLKNSIRRLDQINSRVVSFDIAKQDVSKGIAFTIFRNFLKSIDLPQNEHGYFLFQLMINESKTDVRDFIYEKLGSDWDGFKTRLIEYSKAVKNIFLGSEGTDSDYHNMMSTIRREIDQFSSTKLNEELRHYLKLKNDERIVFLFDETSEALNQNKFTLLDLEGVSESLSSLGGRVWTIAIAQEKLDDVINNGNVSKAQLTKVTDRFKTKIHLEATEVDIIIQNRLLGKSEEGLKLLEKNFKEHSGKISDHSLLQGVGSSKTDTEDSYKTYYPFYKHQFELLQNFLFGTKGYASTKVAARGMIYTTYEILKLELQNSPLFQISTGWQISKVAQQQPDARLVNRFTNAENILKTEGSLINGRRLLETINFLREAEVIPTTFPNILKSYTSDSEEYYKKQDQVAKALEILTEAKILLDSNKTYRITSDVEQRLLDEMNAFTVQGYNKKNKFTQSIKVSQPLKHLARINEEGQQFDFYITSDNDDELTNPVNKTLKIKIKSLYNISDNRETDIELLKVQHQNDKDLIWLVPDNKNFKLIDRLIEEIEKISYLEQKYNNPNSEEGKILQSFTSSKEEKIQRLTSLVEDALLNSSAIYLFNTFQLSKENNLSVLSDQQRKVVQNIYHKKLSSQLSDTLAVTIIKESHSSNLKRLFSGPDFQFFDPSGNFIGENLKVSGEILFKCRNTFLDGQSLEKDLELPPTGFAFGTVMSTVAALMRGGKLIAKYNGSEKYSWKDDGVPDIFKVAKNFRNTSFKAVTKSLSAAEKQDLVKVLLQLDIEDYVQKKIDYNTNDFELINAVRDLSRTFCDKVKGINSRVSNSAVLFPELLEKMNFLEDFTGAVSDSNYIDKAKQFLTSVGEYELAVAYIKKIERFANDNLIKANKWKEYVESVQDELAKASVSLKPVQELAQSFSELYSSNLTKNFAQLQQAAQKVKDQYHVVFEEAAAKCSENYKQIAEQINSLKKKIQSLPSGLNRNVEYTLENAQSYATNRILKEIELGFDVKETKSKFTYSEILSFIDLASQKRTDLELIEAGLKTQAPEPLQAAEEGVTTAVKIKKISSKLPSKNMKVGDYRKWLKSELYKVSSAGEEDEIELD